MKEGRARFPFNIWGNVQADYEKTKEMMKEASKIKGMREEGREGEGGREREV